MKSAQEIYKSVITNTLYPPRITRDCAQHNALAKHHPQGKIAYYNKEMAILREKIVKEDNLITRLWMESDFSLHFIETPNLFEYIDATMARWLKEREIDWTNEGIPKDKIQLRYDVWIDSIEKQFESYILRFMWSYEVYRYLASKREEEKNKDILNPNKSRPQFTNAALRAIYDEFRHLKWKDGQGKPTPCIKESDASIFLDMVHHREPSSKMTWLATTPNNKKCHYVKPLIELLVLMGISWDQMLPTISSYFIIQYNEQTIECIKSHQRAGIRWSAQYRNIVDIVNRHTTQQ